MAKSTGSYKFEKRKKEIARQKKQEEKRQRQQQKKLDKQNAQNEPGSGESPAVPDTPVDAESSGTESSESAAG